MPDRSKQSVTHDLLVISVQVVPSWVIFSLCWLLAEFIDAGHGDVILGTAGLRYKLARAMVMAFGATALLYVWTCIERIKERRIRNSTLRWGRPMQVFKSFDLESMSSDDDSDYSASFILALALLVLMGSLILTSIPCFLSLAIVGMLSTPHQNHHAPFWSGIILFRWGGVFFPLGVALILLPWMKPSSPVKWRRRAIIYGILTFILLVVGATLLTYGAIMQLVAAQQLVTP